MYLKSRLALRQGVHGNPGDTVLTTVQLHHQVFQTEAKLGKLHKIQKARKTDVSFYGPYTFQGFYPHHSKAQKATCIFRVAPCKWTVASMHSHLLINTEFVIVSKLAVRFLRVAGEGFEPPTSRLWALRAASAPPRIKKGCFYYHMIGFTSLAEHPWKQSNILILIFFIVIRKHLHDKHHCFSISCC